MIGLLFFRNFTKIKHMSKTDCFRQYLIIAIAFLICHNALAQRRDISVLAGTDFVMKKGVSGSCNSPYLTINYGQFSDKGFGFRAGVKWNSEYAGCGDVLGVPVSFVYKTPSKERWQNPGLLGSAFDGYPSRPIDVQYLYDEYEKDCFGQAVVVTLMSIFVEAISNAEAFVGVTPGVVTRTYDPEPFSAYPGLQDGWDGTEYTICHSWVDKKSDFMATLDAGVCVNIGIWKFDLKLMPAFHYDLTGNFVWHEGIERAGVNELSVYHRPISWYFSFGLGLAYRF